MRNMDINHQLLKFISSQQMESSETQKRIINLGKALVEELELDPGVDTLARWMAHYVSEQIETAKAAQSDEKTKIEQCCFETIFKLWQHRASLPKGSRPFENFEPIFQTLEKLDPDKRPPFYYSIKNPKSQGQNESSDDNNEVQQWLSVIQSIDEAARVWLNFAIQQAIQNAKDETTIKWLENAIDLPGNDEIQIIVSFDGDGAGAKKEREKHKNELEKLKSRVDQLDSFIEFSKTLRKAYLSEIKRLDEMLNKE